MAYRKLLRMISKCEEDPEMISEMIAVMYGMIWQAYEEDRLTPEEYRNLRTVCRLFKRSYED